MQHNESTKKCSPKKERVYQFPKNTHKLYVNNTPAQSASLFGKFKYIADAKWLVKNTINK